MFIRRSLRRFVCRYGDENHAAQPLGIRDGEAHCCGKYARLVFTFVMCRIKAVIAQPRNVNSGALGVG